MVVAMAKVVFLSLKKNFTGPDLRTGALGGIPSGTIILAEALQRLGNEVIVYNETQKPEVYKGVEYRSYRKGERILADLAISNNTAKPLLDVEAPSHVVWQRNRTSLSRIYKRNETWALLRLRPHLVTLSKDACAATPGYIPYRAKHIIPHAIDSCFTTSGDAPVIPERQIAVFASRPSRNLQFVVDCWKAHIFPALPNAEFHICAPPGTTFPFEADELAPYNIILRGSLSKEALADLMRSSRVLLYPGHRAETGCQVAQQAIGVGLPIVTCGIGSLSDLVVDGRTGYIEEDPKKYSEKAILCLSDDQRWRELATQVRAHPERKYTDDRAAEWQALFL